MVFAGIPGIPGKCSGSLPIHPQRCLRFCPDQLSDSERETLSRERETEIRMERAPNTLSRLLFSPGNFRKRKDQSAGDPLFSFLFAGKVRADLQAMWPLQAAHMRCFVWASRVRVFVCRFFRQHRSSYRVFDSALWSVRRQILYPGRPPGHTNCVINRTSPSLLPCRPAPPPPRQPRCSTGPRKGG